MHMLYRIRIIIDLPFKWLSVNSNNNKKVGNVLVFVVDMFFVLLAITHFIHTLNYKLILKLLLWLSQTNLSWTTAATKFLFISLKLSMGEDRSWTPVKSFFIHIATKNLILNWILKTNSSSMWAACNFFIVIFPFFFNPDYYYKSQLKD